METIRYRKKCLCYGLSFLQSVFMINSLHEQKNILVGKLCSAGPTTTCLPTNVNVAPNSPIF